MRQILAVFFVLVSFFLVGCGQKKQEVEYQNIKFDSLVLSLPKDYFLVNLDKNVVDKFKIEQAFKEQIYSGFSSSLIISKYIGQYPSDKKKFFSVISDKFVRKVPGSQILSTGKFSVGKNDVFYFTYAIKNNLFDDTKPDYYGLQAYFFEPDQIYALNYLTATKEKLDKFVDLLKHIQLLKK